MPLPADSVLGLIPQRPPMVMIDQLLSCEGREAVSSLLIREDNLFIRQGRLTAPGLIENMAQTAAARTGFLAGKNANGVNKKAPVGVIGSVKNFRIHSEPPVGSGIITTIRVEHEVMLATVVHGRVECDGKLSAEADLQIFLTEEETRTT